MKEKDTKRQRKTALNGSNKSPEISSGDVRSLMHDLGVHREELKSQNEELQLAQLELSQARDRYKELFDSAPIGYLVLDVRMPEISGLELQEQLAKAGIFLPIIFISGHGTVPMSVRAMKAGAVDFL